MRNPQPGFYYVGSAKAALFASLMQEIGMGVLLAILFLLVAPTNLAVLVISYWRRSFVSFIPIIGGLAGTAACFALPYPALRAWCWVPLLADIGAAPLMLATLVAWHIRRRKKDVRP